MSGRFTVEAVFKAIDRVTLPVSRMQGSIRKFTSTATHGFRTLDRQVSRTNASIRQSAGTIALGATIIGGALGKVISVGAKFEENLISAAARMPDFRGMSAAAILASKEFEEMSEKAKEMGLTTEFTSGQAALAFKFLAFAGFDAKNAIGLMADMVDFATASELDLARATDIITDSLGAFGLKSKDAGENMKAMTRISDAFVLASSSANLTVEQLFESIKQGAPVGSTLKVTLEEIVAMSAILSNAGIKSTRAATTMKNIFLALRAPGSEAGKVLKRIGVELFDKENKAKSMVSIFRQLGEALERMGDAQDAATVKRVFGLIPIAGALNLTSAVDDFEEFGAMIEGHSKGVTKWMATLLRSTTIKRWQMFWSAIERTAIGAFEFANKPINDVIRSMTEFVRLNQVANSEKLGEFIANFANNFVDIVKNTVSFLKFLAGWILFSAVLKAVVLLMTAFNLLLALNPLTLFVLSVAVLAGWLVWVATHLDEISAALDEWPALLQPIANVLQLIIDAARGVRDLTRMGSEGVANKVFEALHGEQVAEGRRGLTKEEIESERLISSFGSANQGDATITLSNAPGVVAEVTSGKLGPNMKMQESAAF